MCGIVGSIHFGFDPSLVDSVMGHRGPDERNAYCSGPVSFYHLRLSIQDIAGGHQPMHYLDRYTIIFNGEIYNHQELRARYDLTCQTHSDTETILQLYHRLGKKCLDEFDGMFAFAIYDHQQRTIFLARDRAGKKPLYYYLDQDKFVFSSELNTLRVLLPLEVNEDTIATYLRLGAMYRQETPYRGVAELENGSWLLIKVDDLALEKGSWWDILPGYCQRSSLSFAETLEKVDYYLHQGVKRRLEASDLEVGAFLSGGIDSGLVTAIAAQYTSRLRTFTVSFSGAYDEAPLARLVADKYQTEHTEISISFDTLGQDIERIIGNYGEPFFDSSAIPSYYVSQAAKAHITVVLNGDGADELFAGYRRYLPFRYSDFFSRSVASRLFFRFLHQAMPVAHDKQSVYNYLYRLAGLASKSGPEVYLSSTTDIFEGYTKVLLGSGISPNFLRDFSRIADHPKLTGLRKLMLLDFNTLLFSDLLVKMDIATMAHSLEGRSPFLCKEILAFAPTISDHHKLKGKTTKYLLRQLAGKYLPGELIHQPKRGFEIPLKAWVEDELREVIFDHLDTNSFAAKFVDRKFINDLKDSRVKVSREKRAKMLWALFALEVWYKHQKMLGSKLAN